LMDDTLNSVSLETSYPFQIADINQCVHQHLDANNVDFGEMRFHPGPAGHRAYADCLAEQVLRPALARKYRK